jgi:hypothetical protein
MTAEDGPRMTAEPSSPPDPLEVGTVADFVQSLVRLRQWAGEPPLSKLRSLGGRTATPDGTLVDALPKSTTSYVLRQPDKLPRWDFVKAFVTACLRYCDHPAESIPGELERWRTARSALAEPPTRARREPAGEEPPTRTPREPVGEEPPAQPPEPAGATRTPATARATVQPARTVVADTPAPAVPPAATAHAGTGRLDRAVELLARRVAREEDRARKGLLGGYSIAPVSFSFHADSSGDDDGDAEVPDDLHSIGRLFRGLRPQRLLVVGESGAGKTVLAIELVLQLVEPIVAAGGPPHAQPMVPVRLSAARWTPGSPFEQWLGEQLVRNFGIAGSDAARLVRDRRVLPVLDGLDELDPEPCTGPPRRAMGLLAELNRYSDLSGRRPGAVVVTCRADRHTQLAEERVVLDDAAHAYLRDLTVEQISAYLHLRWPDRHPCKSQRDDIHAALTGTSGAAIHSALRTPWRLSLVATAVESGADPAELLYVAPAADPSEAAARIGRRLLEAYVPAATELTPRTAHGTPYHPVQVRSWLECLAGHLRWQAVRAAETDRPPPGLTEIDIVPHLLWPIGGWRRVRALHSLFCAISAVIAMLAFWLGSAVDRPGDLRDAPGAGEALTLALMAAWVAIATGLSLSPWPTAAGGRANVPHRRRMIGGLLGALTGGPVGVLGGLAGLVLTGGRVFGPAFAVAAGAAGGAVFGALIGLTAAGRQRGEHLAVSEVIRDEFVTLLGFGLCGALTGLPPLRLAGVGPVALVVGLAGTFALAFALGVVFKIATGGWSTDAELAHPREALRRNPITGVGFGLIGGVAALLVFVMHNGVVESLTCALIGGVTFGLAFGAITWVRATIGLVVAAMRGMLPLRLWTFLDWACEAQLLRVSGATFQFRHRELQEFLAPSEDVVPRR